MALIIPTPLLIYVVLKSNITIKLCIDYINAVYFLVVGALVYANLFFN